MVFVVIVVFRVSLGVKSHLQIFSEVLAMLSWVLDEI